MEAVRISTTDLSLQDQMTAINLRVAEYDPSVQPLVAQLLMEDVATLSRRSPVIDTFRHRSLRSLILELGTVRAAKIQTDIHLGTMEAGLCYMNAYDAIMEYEGYTYVEGIAQLSWMATPHAWLEDENGTIIDPTWVGLEHAAGEIATYAGVRFDPMFVLARVRHTGWHSIFGRDWEDDYTILRRGLKLDQHGRAYALGDLT